MANRLQREGGVVRARIAQPLVEIKTCIYESMYWKEQCFGLATENVIDKVAELRFIGGIYMFGENFEATPFLCLTLKLLQLQPEKEIIVEFIRQDDYKYIRALGAFYIRLTFTPFEIYKYLAPLYNDFRKLRYMNKEGGFELIHMDQFIYNLLVKFHCLGIDIPRLPTRGKLEKIVELDLYSYVLDTELHKIDVSDSDEDEKRKKPKPRLVSRKRSRSRSRSPKRRSGKKMKLQNLLHS